MSWQDSDEVTITYGTLSNASKEAFDMGHRAALEDVLDMLALQNCGHTGCAKCDAYTWLADHIQGKLS